ncbi:MAG: energy transducer TonB [Bacteroidota bacterium]
MKTFSVILFLSALFTISINAQDIAVLTDQQATVSLKQEKQFDEKAAFIPNVEVRASFNGSLLDLAQFFEDHLIYPGIGRANLIEGIVLVEFTVAADGSIENAKVVRGLGQGLGFDEEALRLVNMMPKWTPAQQGTRTVATKLRIPIAFVL